jgi:hypothetical protein
MEAALAFAIALFASFPVEQHGICRVYFVQREPALEQAWWACGACYYEGRFLIAAALIRCPPNKSCEWARPAPQNSNPGICETRDK